MITSVDAYVLLAGAALGFAGAAVLFVLRPSMATPPTASTNGSNGHPRHARAVRHPVAGLVPEAPADGDDASEVGPYPRLAAEVVELRHAIKLLQNEWADKESRMDALMKRAWRLRKLEEAAPSVDAPAAPVLSAAEQRAEILRRHRGGA